MRVSAQAHTLNTTKAPSRTHPLSRLLSSSIPSDMSILLLGGNKPYPLNAEHHCAFRPHRCPTHFLPGESCPSQPTGSGHSTTMQRRTNSSEASTTIHQTCNLLETSRTKPSGCTGPAEGPQLPSKQWIVWRTCGHLNGMLPEFEAGCRVSWKDWRSCMAWPPYKSRRISEFAAPSQAHSHASVVH